MLALSVRATLRLRLRHFLLLTVNRVTSASEFRIEIRMLLHFVSGGRSTSAGHRSLPLLAYNWTHSQCII